MSSGSHVASPGDRFVIRREKQVSWFDTRQLAATGSQALAATIVGSMSGRREIMAALEPGLPPPLDYSDQEEVWLDYIADTGDGWNATTSIAWLAGRDGITLKDDGSPTPQMVPADCYTEGMPVAREGEFALPAGQILICGGDQVYPTASPENYQHRFVDPLRCARWYDQPDRALLAIPGNHDWYDGLTSFIRLFCQSPDSRRWFGCWQAKQRRSYFSMALPHRWWVWGVDTALEEDLDPPQFDYFRHQASLLLPGDQLILVVPAPTWLKRSPASETATRDIAADKLDIIMGLPAKVGHPVDIPLLISGDHHYYARHQQRMAHGQRHYVVCGGGGAFGLGTLQVPDCIEVPGPETCETSCSLQATFPDAEASVALRRGILKFPRQNPAFTAMLAAAQAVILWLLTNSSPDWLGQLVRSELSFGELCGLMAKALESAATSPALLLWLVTLLLGFGAFASGARPRHLSKRTAWAIGLFHALLQLAGGFICIWLAAKAAGFFSGWGSDDPLRLIARSIGDDWAALLLAAPLTYLYCGFLFGLYLFASHKFAGLHDQEVFSAQGIEGYKCFLRISVNSDALTIYPVGLTKHVSHWRGAEGVEISTRSRGVFGKLQEVIVPKGAQRVVDPCEELRPHLIEEPIIIRRKAEG